MDMSLIPCTQPCRFQLDGVCRLDRAKHSVTQARPNDLCLDFTPCSDQRGDCLTDVDDPDQAEPLGDHQFSAASGRDKAFGEAQPADL